MKDRITLSPKYQNGAILIISLLFLIAITLLTISSMGSSNIGLHMAQNEESRIVAEQGAQALADAIVSDPSTTRVVGESGYAYCTAGESGCNSGGLTVSDPILAAWFDRGHGPELIGDGGGALHDAQRYGFVLRKLPGGPHWRDSKCGRRPCRASARMPRTCPRSGCAPTHLVCP